MKHDSDLYEYLLARHNTFFNMGVVLVTLALIFAVSGVCFVPRQGISLRSKDPKMFWLTVAMYYVLGVVSLALCLYARS